ncbi:MAG TPA: MBL fold metallo-hydrolase [Candidatus Didemnitutus sp.]|jgi:glyoxylase-like metal-dependent hydrolase (beta-lactamase superfamily II)
MPRIPLEDNVSDVLGKAQRGLKLTDPQIVTRAKITAAEWKALKAGEIRDVPLRAVARVLGLGGDALLELARKEWYPEQPLFPRGFAMFNTAYEDMRVNSYLVWDPRSRLAAAFDTGADASDVIGTVHAEKLTLRYVFITHTHEDHVADLARLVAAGKPEIWSGEREPVDLPGAKTFKENAHFHLGELAIKTLDTSGHSPGQTTFYITGLSWPLAVVGDSLFAGSMGGSPTHYEDQFRNNRRKLLNLPLDTVFACGHGPLTTLRQEKRHNPFFTR